MADTIDYTQNNILCPMGISVIPEGKTEALFHYKAWEVPRKDDEIFDVYSGDGHRILRVTRTQFFPNMPDTVDVYVEEVDR